jgi:hypothetical protein
LDLQQLLQNLKLNTIAARFDEMLATAEASGTPIPTLFTQLLRAEWHARQEQALEARIKRANFRENCARQASRRTPTPWGLRSSPEGDTERRPDVRVSRQAPRLRGTHFAEQSRTDFAEAPKKTHVDRPRNGCVSKTTAMRCKISSA